MAWFLAWLWVWVVGAAWGATTLDGLVVELEEVARQLETEPEVRAHWERLRVQHGLQDEADVFEQFVRVRLAHEALRAGGWAGTRWTVTDQPPQSDAIWKGWAEGQTVVDAECDELSALFAFVVRRLGVSEVGLFWPTWNHTVAVWTAPGVDGPVRIVVPTSQIFLSAEAGLGTKGFDPSTQRTIYRYGRQDLAGDTVLPDALVERILEGARRFGGVSEAELVRRRLAGQWGAGSP